MKKTKIAFEDIKAGDLIEAVAVINGIKYTGTGIAFEKTKTKQGDAEWQTSEGGTITIEDDEDAIYRIDVAEVKFEDIRKGDRVRVTTKMGNTTSTIEGVAIVKVQGVVGYWVDGEGHLLVVEQQAPDSQQAIEILERTGKTNE
jgi:hypothetical protein